MSAVAVAARCLLAIGLFGLATSTVFLALVLLGAIRFRRASRREERALARRPQHLPAITLFKPLCGDEPGLEPNLRSFFQQVYPAPFEILFAARTLHDPGLILARRIATEFPHIPARFIAAGEPWAPNAKVCSLAALARCAAHDLWIISDSDVRVPPDYLRRIAAPFEDPAVGCVTCLYRGRAEGRGLWAHLEAAGMTVEMSAGVSVVNLLEPMRFALGPTMAARRACVRQIGGFESLAHFCADDFLLGNRIEALGHKVVLSSLAVDHFVLHTSLAASLRHQVRWMRSTRFSRPRGHLGTCLTFGMPFGLLAWASALALHHAALAWTLLAACLAGRLLQAFVMAAFMVRERRLWPTLLLFPLRDLMGLLFWTLSYAGNRILWRGERYELLPGGRMQRIHPTPHPWTQAPNPATPTSGD